MSALREWFFPTALTFVVRSPVDADTIGSRLFAAIQPPRPWATSVPGEVAGTVSGRRLDAYVAGRRNSWRPIMHARIEPAPGGGSAIHGTIATSRWVNVFMLVWLIGAASLAGLLLVASLIGVVTGTAVMRDGTGRPMPPAIGLAVSAGAFLLFGGAGLAFPRIGRRMAAGDPDRLIAFVVVASNGVLDEPGRSQEREGLAPGPGAGLDSDSDSFES